MPDVNDVLDLAPRLVEDNKLDRAYELILGVLPRCREVLVPFVRTCLLTVPSLVPALFVQKAHVSYSELLAILSNDNGSGVHLTFVPAATCAFVKAVFSYWRSRRWYVITDVELLALFRALLLIDVPVFDDLRFFMTDAQRTKTVFPRLFECDNRDELLACVSPLFLKLLSNSSLLPLTSDVWRFSSYERQMLFWRFIEDDSFLSRWSFARLLPADFRVTRLPDVRPSPYVINWVTEDLCKHDLAAVAESIVWTFVRYSAETQERARYFIESAVSARALLLRFPALSFDTLLVFLARKVEAQHMLRFLVGLMGDRLTISRCFTALHSAFRVDNAAAVLTLYADVVGRVSECTHNNLLRSARAASAGKSALSLIKCWRWCRFMITDTPNCRGRRASVVAQT